MSSSYSNYGSDWCRQIIEDLEQTGSFEIGIVSDRKQRGTAINVDVMHEDSAQGLFVLQVRQCHFRPGRFNRVRKNYYLCGRNENGNAFAHGVELRATNARVEVAQCRIWDVTPSQLQHVIRQGDVAIIPERGVTFSDVERLDAQPFIVDSETDSHVFTPGALYVKGNKFYVAESVQIRHTKDQHPYVSARLQAEKLYRVQVGIRHNGWRFSLDSRD